MQNFPFDVEYLCNCLLHSFTRLSADHFLEFGDLLTLGLKHLFGFELVVSRRIQVLSLTGLLRLSLFHSFMRQRHRLLRLNALLLVNLQSHRLLLRFKFWYRLCGCFGHFIA